MQATKFHAMKGILLLLWFFTSVPEAAKAFQAVRSHQVSSGRLVQSRQKNFGLTHNGFDGRKRPWSLATLSATRGGSEEAQAEAPTKDEIATSKTVSQLISLFWQMASPFYKESKSGRWLFLTVIGLTFLNSGVSEAFS